MHKGFPQPSLQLSIELSKNIVDFKISTRSNTTDYFYLNIIISSKEVK